MTPDRPSQAVLADFTPQTAYPLRRPDSQTTQALCYDSEGWGPLSPIRFDFTPCFLDVLVVALAAYGVVFGGLALFYLSRKKRPAPIKRNWHLYLKLVCGRPSLVEVKANIKCSLSLASLPSLLPSKPHSRFNIVQDSGRKTFVFGRRSLNWRLLLSSGTCSILSIKDHEFQMALFSSSGCSSSQLTP